MLLNFMHERMFLSAINKELSNKQKTSQKIEVQNDEIQINLTNNETKNMSSLISDERNLNYDEHYES